MSQIPKQQDIVVIDAEPHSGREYGGHNPKTGNIRRHMVVVSSTDYNQATGMIIGMPITTNNKYANKPMFMPILINGANGTGVKGNIVLWQLQNFDFNARNGVIVNRIDNRSFSKIKLITKDIFNF